MPDSCVEAPNYGKLPPGHSKMTSGRSFTKTYSKHCARRYSLCKPQGRPLSREIYPPPTVLLCGSSFRFGFQAGSDTGIILKCPCRRVGTGIAVSSCRAIDLSGTIKKPLTELIAIYDLLYFVCDFSNENGFNQVELPLLQICHMVQISDSVTSEIMESCGMSQITLSLALAFPRHGPGCVAWACVPV